MMNMNCREYDKYVRNRAKKSPVLKNSIRAFFVGGGICLLGQGMKALYLFLGTEEKTAGILVSVSLIFISSAFTSAGIFDRAAKFAGAGVLVPITGFANAVVAPAIDTRSEGYILGVGSKIFTISGAVILFGTVSGALYGLIYFLCRCFSGVI